MQSTDLKAYNLSLQQARLWALQGNSQAYRTQCTLRLDGLLDLDLFLDACQKLLEKYDILRTAFQHFPGMDIPVQVVANASRVHCLVINLENLSALSQTAYLDEYLTGMRQQKLHLDTDSLLQMSILRLSATAHLFFLQLPALCADSYTLTYITQELCQRYASRLSENDLDEEPLQYADVAAWQEQLLLSEESQSSCQYWRAIDLSQLDTLSLPFEQKDARQNSVLPVEQRDHFKPSSFEIPLAQSLAAQIKHTAHQYGVPIDAWLLACWQVTLWRLNGKQDLLLGVACDGRNYDDLTQALGLYTRFVPISVHIKEDLPFDLLIESVNTSLQEAIEQQTYFTWETSLTTSKTASHLSSQFFPLCFEYESWPDSLSAGALSLSLYQRFSCTEPFTLKLSVLQSGTHLQVEIQYDPQHINMSHLRRIAATFHTILQGTIAQPHTQVSMLPLLETDTHTSLLAMGHGPLRTLPSRLFHQLFEEQAERFPDYQAAISAHEQLTYTQLNEQANQLAHVLQQRGVGPNVLVGLCMTRSTRMLVGLLGILKAGGAYLPLDPGSPAARLIYQLQESKSAFLLTQQAVMAPEWEGKTLTIEELAPELALAPPHNTSVRSGPEDLAYVIYTSGSTGQPKGVMIRQSNIVNYTLALCNHLEGKAGWHYATVATLAADLGNTAIFCSLVSGGCIQILDYETVTSAEMMARWVAQHPIDVLKIVPSHLSALLTGDRAQTLIPRQALILGGEALPVPLLERLQEIGASCQIYNHYGPTETTIGVLVHKLPQVERAQK